MRAAIDMTQDAHAELNRMADKLGVPMAEIIRQSLNLLKIYTDAQDAGKYLAIIDDDNISKVTIK